MSESRDFGKFPERQLRILRSCRHSGGAFVKIREDCIEQSIPDCFEERARTVADRTAVVDDGGSLSYGALNEAANRLSHRILKTCADEVEPIGSFVSPGRATAISFLAILKAGRIYVPLDVSDPGIALGSVYKDAGIQAVVVSNDTNERARQLFLPDVRLINIDREMKEESSENPGLKLAPESPAYIIYSSGTTGTPKGVVQIHRNLLHDRMNLVNFYGLCPEDRTTHLHSPIHATSPTDLTTAFLSGASVHVWDFRKRGLTDLVAWLVEQRITVLHWVPTLFRALCETIPMGLRLDAVRLIILGSEPVTRRDLECYRRCFTDSAIFINRLGSVETENYRLFYADKQTALPKAGLPCGYAVPGREVLLVDERGALCPPGATGEIIVRSHFLARGYWKRPDLTANAFSEDGQTGMRIFRTRDLGRMSADGCMTYLGRKDHRFKVRGQFADPLEVESVLTRQAAVRDAVVVGEEGELGDLRLVAYLKTDGIGQPTPNALNSALRDHLPGYMIPARYIRIEQIPISPVGKIDRKKLMAGDIVGIDIDSEPPRLPEAPVSDLEATLISLWEDTLGSSGVGRRQSFLDDGGDSLKGMMFLNRVRQKLGIRVHIVALFDAPTIAEFAAYLEEHYAVGNGDPSSGDSGAGREPSLTPESLARFQNTALAAWSNHGKTIPASTGRNPRAVFILAPPRSGTTLMRVMLGGSPRLFAPPELHLMNFLTLRERQAALAGRLEHQQEGVLQAIMETKNCSVEAAMQLMDDCVNRELTTQQFYGCLQKWAGDRMLVEKTPEYANHIDTLRRAEAWFEDARYIHLLRHPCGQVVSYADARLDRMTAIPHNHTPRVLGELLWTVSHRNILDFLSEVPPERQQRIRYEALVRAPVEQTQQLAEFLRVEYHPNMSNPYVEQRGRMTESIHPLTKPLGDEKFSTFRQIDPTMAERWRDRISPDSLSAPTWNLAETLGYEKS